MNMHQLAKLQARMAKHFPSFSEQKEWLNQLKRIDSHVKSAHNQSHILKFLLEILEMPDSVQGCVIEAGAFKGSLLSFFKALMKRFHYEKSTEGHSIKGWFDKGNFAGSLDEVKKNIDEYGKPEVVSYHKGWFEETMPLFKEKIALVYIDVDLASSTKTCLKYLYPLLEPGGVIVSQDGDFPLVIEVFKDENSGRMKLDVYNSAIEGLGKNSNDP